MLTRKGPIALPSIAFSVSVLLAVFSAADLGAQKQEQRCGFSGTFAGMKINKGNSQCSVQRAGTSPYLLVSIREAGGWLIDLSGIQPEGTANLTIKIMGPGGFNGPQSVAYTAAFKSRALRHPQKAEIRAFKLKLEAKSADGKQTKAIEGLFAWTISSDPDETGGSLSVTAGSESMQSPKARLTKWSSGYRISQLFVLRPGETMTYSLVLPSLTAGEYSAAGKTKSQLMHMTSKDGKFTSRIYSSDTTRVTVTGSGASLRIQFEGKLKDARGEIPVRGEFQAAP